MAIVKLDPTGSGAISLNDKIFIAGGLNGNLRAYAAGANEIILGYNSGEIIVREIESNFRDRDGESFIDREAILLYVQANFKKASSEGGEGPQPEILPAPVFGAATKDDDSITQPVINRPTGAATVWLVNEESAAGGEDFISLEDLEPDTDYVIKAKYTKAGSVDGQFASVTVRTNEATATNLMKGEARPLGQPLSWGAHPLTDIYQVQRSTSINFAEYEVLRTGKGLSYTDRMVVPGETYFWRVVPKYAGIDLPASNIVTGTMPAMTGNIYEVGGSNQLMIYGNSFIPNGYSDTVALQSGDTIEILGGNYDYIDIDVGQDFDPENPVLIKAKNAPVVVTGNGSTLWIGNVSGLHLTGRGLPDVEYGFQLINSNQRVIEAGLLKDITFDHFLLANITNQSIQHVGSFKETGYNESDTATYCENLRFLDFSVINTGPFIMFDGDQTATGFKGVVKNIEVAGCKISDCPNAGSIIYLGSVDQYDVHDNTFERINKGQTNHVTIFFTKGVGAFYSNKGVDNFGNMTRFWPRKLSSTITRSVDSYNNIYYDTDQYGMFELQVPGAEYNINPSGFFPIDSASFDNNTAGLLGNNPEAGFDYKARLIDLYANDHFGTVTMRNNLLFEDYDNTGQFTQLNNPDAQANNIYSPTEAAAVEDNVRFVSLHEGVGATI